MLTQAKIEATIYLQILTSFKRTHFKQEIFKKLNNILNKDDMNFL